MKKLKLTDVQKHRAMAAERELVDVLREIKQKPLEGPALHTMQQLEQSVQFLESFRILTR